MWLLLTGIWLCLLLSRFGSFGFSHVGLCACTSGFLLRTTLHRIRCHDPASALLSDATRLSCLHDIQQQQPFHWSVHRGGHGFFFLCTSTSFAVVSGKCPFTVSPTRFMKGRRQALAGVLLGAAALAAVVTWGAPRVRVSILFSTFGLMWISMAVFVI